MRKEICNGIEILLQRLWGYFFIKVKDNRIAFMSIPDYADNARALSEYLMLEKKDKYEIIWFVKEPDKLREKYKDLPIKFYSHQKVNGRYSWDSVMAAYSCKKVFFTHRFLLQKKWCKKQQEIFNLWHGCGYKASENTANKKLNRDFDYVFVPGSVFVDIKARFFSADPHTVLPIGYPRYDVLRKGSVAAKEYLFKLIAENEKLIVWMPTFRKSEEGDYPEAHIQQKFDLPLLNSLDELEELNYFCQQRKVVLCIKRHPFQISYACEIQKYSNLIFLSNSDFEKEEVELYAFLKYTDALISDYSSVAIDYLLLDKPIGFALGDFEQYDKVRGFVFENPLNYMPGHHLYNKEDLINFISDISKEEDPYKRDRDRIMPEVHNPCSSYCRRIWEAIEDISENRKEF